MNVRGAPLIAIVALLGLCVDLKHKYNENTDGDLMEYVRKSCDYLRESRPTAVNLSNEILKLKEFINNLSGSGGIEDLKR
jgi:methylthioribose-1-phosphate isomerase